MELGLVEWNRTSVAQAPLAIAPDGTPISALESKDLNAANQALVTNWKTSVECLRIVGGKNVSTSNNTFRQS